jgi:SAM-dependent methyltransferase
MDAFSADTVRAAYDEVAADYVAAFGDDLARLPVDRAMLDAALNALPAGLPTMDLGCGPGAVASYLSARGAQVVGVDLSARMLALAHASEPALRPVQGDMRRLPFRTGTYGLIVAFYSIQHVPRSCVVEVLEEITRVLSTPGALLIATHLGEGDVYTSDFLGHQIDALGGALYHVGDLVGHLQTCGLLIEVEKQREPLPHEHDTRRVYLLARKGT